MRRLLGLMWLACGANYDHKKVSVSETVLSSQVEELVYLGKDHRHVLLRTRDGTLHHSADRGRTWKDITEDLPGYSSEAHRGVHSFVLNKKDREVIAVGDGKSAVWVSFDAGVSFHLLRDFESKQLHVHNVVFHAEVPSLALVGAWTSSCYEGDQSECRQDLFVTKDKFSTFERVASYVIQYGWGDPSDKQHPTRIFFSHHLEKTGGQPMYGGWHTSVAFCSTDNFGHTVKKHVPAGNKFMVGDGFIFVAMSVDAARQTVALMVSSDNGRTFRQALFPFSKYLVEKSYTILDTKGGAVMLHVNHGHAREGGVATGNIYISDATGLEYALSLPGNVRTSYGECEFDRVQGVSGVYIANFNDEPDEENEDQDDDGLDAVRGHGRASQNVRTVISFDKGGVWSYLSPPKVDSVGKPIECHNAGRCFLHLHGISRFSMFAPFYSAENSPGIVMGTGNVGDRLTDREAEVNTFISRDGGLTWDEAHKGAFIYEYGDHGGLIVMVDDTKETDLVVFSWNEGHSWFDFNLGSDSVTVDNVVTDPDFAGLEFILYGSRGEAGGLFHLDFSPLQHGSCRNPHLADSVSSDYETWIPSDGRAGNGCLLGVQSRVVRRKRTSECFNGREFKRPTTEKTCQCTMEDFECTMGFTRDINSYECRPDRSGYAHPDCFSARLVEVEAYRKIPGDRCEGGWQPKKVLVMCHEMSPLSSGARRVLSVLLCGVGVVTLLICVNNNPLLRSYLGQFHGGSGEYGTVRPRRVAAGNVFTFYGPSEEPDLGFIETEEQKESEIPQLMRFSPAAESIDQVAVGPRVLGRREPPRELL